MAAIIFQNVTFSIVLNLIFCLVLKNMNNISSFIFKCPLLHDKKIVFDILVTDLAVSKILVISDQIWFISQPEHIHKIAILNIYPQLSGLNYGYYQ